MPALSSVSNSNSQGGVLFNRGKITVTCSVCGAQVETVSTDTSYELHKRSWSVSHGIITCPKHAHMKWPLTRRRSLPKSVVAR